MLRAARYVAVWAAVWAIQYQWAPHWLVGGRSAIATIFQMLPGVLIAVFALIVASLYLVGQQAVNAYGNRGIIVLTSDVAAASLLVRALLLVLAALLLSGQVPDQAPSRGATAATATLLLAGAVLIARATNTLAYLLGSYLAPRSFMLRCLSDAPREFVNGDTRVIDARTTALAEMLRVGITRHEFNTVDAAADGLDRVVQMYCAASTDDPSVRDLATLRGPIHGWLGYELSSAFIAAGEATLAGSSQAEYQCVVNLIDSTCRAFVDAELLDETFEMISANVALGTSPHQIQPGTINQWAQAAEMLAKIERNAEPRSDMHEAAVHALAGWALVVSYSEVHLGHTHPGRSYSHGLLGAKAPWDEALKLVRSETWRRRWANKTGGAFQAVEDTLEARGP